MGWIGRAILLFNFFHIFGIPLSSRHEKRCQILQTLFWVFEYSRNSQWDRKNIYYFFLSLYDLSKQYLVNSIILKALVAMIWVKRKSDLVDQCQWEDKGLHPSYCVRQEAPEIVFFKAYLIYYDNHFKGLSCHDLSETKIRPGRSVPVRRQRPTSKLLCASSLVKSIRNGECFYVWKINEEK